MTFRKVLFWIHLVAGVVSGLSIAIMCFTGTALAFEKELIAWAERDARAVAPPTADASRIPLDQLQHTLRQTFPDARTTSIVLQNDPTAAVAFSAGRTGSFYADPYTGEIRQPHSNAMGTFMQTMIAWHRYLGFGGEVSRPRGKLINGICNVAFCVLAITGLYLWMPRSISWRALRPGIWFTQNSTSKARDWNWHNVIGFWSAPILIVLTLTAMPISFRWTGNLIYTLTGTPAPVAGQRPGTDASSFVETAPPAPGAKPLSQDALFAIAQQQVPDWRTITLRVGGGGGRGAPVRNAESRADVPPISFSIREHGAWPRTATTTLTLDPHTGEVLRRTGYADLNAAQQVRAWTRFLHTGEAIGWGGQLLAGLASLGGVFLVYTGFALTWRRFIRTRSSSSSTRTRRRSNSEVAAPVAR